MMDGIIVMNKPKNYTSHDIVAIVKKKLGEKVGHTGTLDPNATGVLPLLIGKGTKLSKYLVQHDKTYEVTLKLGEKTDTADPEGEVIQEKPVREECFEREKLEEVFQQFLGKQEQTPPIYSAIKVKGKKLYEYARSGQEVEVPKREIEIYAISLQEIRKREKEIVFSVHCSKGTYIRSLCEDIAEKMGTVGYMKELNRTTVGCFRMEQAISMEELENLDCKEIEKKIIPMEQFFLDRPALNLDEKKMTLFQNGVCLTARELNQEVLEDGVYRIEQNHQFIGLGIAKENKIKRDLL